MPSSFQKSYLDILEEIKNDLPWLIQVWLRFRNKDKDTLSAADELEITTIDIPSNKPLDLSNVGTESSTPRK